MRAKRARRRRFVSFGLLFATFVFVFLRLSSPERVAAQGAVAIHGTKDGGVPPQVDGRFLFPVVSLGTYSAVDHPTLVMPSPGYNPGANLRIAPGMSTLPIAIDVAGNSAFQSVLASSVGSFACKPGFYQVLWKDLKYLNPATGADKLIGTSAEEYNAMGWDVREHVLYALGPFPWNSWYAHLLLMRRRCRSRFGHSGEGGRWHTPHRRVELQLFDCW